MMKVYAFFLIFSLLFCSFKCSKNKEDIFINSNKNTDVNKNISNKCSKNKEDIFTNSNKNTDVNKNISKELDILAKLDPIMNNFSKNENPLYILHERNAIATSIITDYIKENGITVELLENLPVAERKQDNGPYEHFSPDDIFYIHKWFLPYAEDISPIELFQELDFLGHTRLNITIIQYKTKSGEIITIPMNNIIDLLDISNVALLNDIRITAQQVRKHNINVINNNIYLFVLTFRHYINNHHSFFDDSYLGEIIFAIKYEEDRFVLQKIFNNEKYLIFFSSVAEPNYYVLGGAKMDIEKEIILITVYKVIGKGIRGHHDEDDPDIIEYKNIELKFNGFKFIGDYKQIYELSKRTEPPNFNVNIITPSIKINN